MRKLVLLLLLAAPSVALAHPDKGEKGDKPEKMDKGDRGDKGEKATGKPAGPAEELAMAIQYTGKELLDMAEDKQYPDAKLDYKPTPEVRSFAEQLLHAAKANMIFTDMANGKKADFSDLPRANYKTRADIAKVLKQSIDDLVATVKKLGDKGLQKPTKMPFGPPQTVSTHFLLTIPMGHMSEHYSQLVVYYRLNKVVPPASRNQGHAPPQP
jgi:uncharacterized damage-inducible protein DinB